MRNHIFNRLGKYCNGSRAWVKSSLSYGNGNCVEVAIARDNGVTLMRDTKNAKSPVLAFSPDGWDAFVDAVRRGEFDRAV
jgi:SH3-like domain-containing protein